MAHAKELYTIGVDPISPKSGELTWEHPCGGPILSRAPTTQYPDGSVAHYIERAASVHTAKDVHGWRPPTNYSARFIDSSLTPESAYAEDGCHWKYNGFYVSTSGLFQYPYWLGRTPFTRYLGVPLENMRSWTKTKAIAKLHKSEFELGVTYGERKRTYNMVVDAIQDVTWFFRMLKRRKYSKIWRAWKRSGSDPWSFYLQFRYGWSQIYRDIFNLLELIEDLEDGTFERLRIYVKSGVKTAYGSSSDNPVFNGGLIANRIVRGTESSFTRMDFTPKDVGYIYLNELGLNPITVGWELIPYSFVADWFINIGTFLEAFTALPGYSYIGGSTTLVGDYVETSTLDLGSFSHVDCPSIDNHMFEFKRVVESSALPRLAINPDILIGKMSAVRIADAVALMAQSRNAIWR